MKNKPLFIILLSFACLVYFSCGKDSQWNDLKGVWSPYMSMKDPEHDITSSYRADFAENGFSIYKICKRSDNLYVIINETIPFELKEKSIVFKKSVDIKVPYRIKNDKVEYPKTPEEIANFPIDNETLYCELQWEAGEWQYEITNKPTNEAVLDISRPHSDSFRISYLFSRKK